MSKEFLKDFKGTVYGYCVRIDYKDAPDRVWYGTCDEAIRKFRETRPFVVEAVRYFNAANPNSWPVVQARREYLSDRIVTVTPARTVGGEWVSDYEVPK